MSKTYRFELHQDGKMQHACTDADRSTARRRLIAGYVSAYEGSGPVTVFERVGRKLVAVYTTRTEMVKL